MMSSQRTSAKEKKDGGKKKLFGAQAGVLLPIAGVTISRNLAKELYSDTTLRSRLACQLGSCGGAIDGPVQDARGHYLHTRRAMVEEILGSPEAWRAKIEHKRLEDALDLTETINLNYLDGSHPIKTRSVRSLLFEIDERIGKTKSA